jgi:hypothetical protein
MFVQPAIRTTSSWVQRRPARRGPGGGEVVSGGRKKERKGEGDAGEGDGPRRWRALWVTLRQRLAENSASLGQPSATTATPMSPTCAQSSITSRVNL